MNMTINQLLDRLYMKYTHDQIMADRDLGDLGLKLIALKAIYGGKQMLDIKNEKLIRQIEKYDLTRRIIPA